MQMLVRSVWSLVLGLALLCPAAQTGAVPCRDDSCGKRADRDASAIQLQRREQVGARFDDGWRSGVDAPSLSLRESDELPPGLRKRDGLPPGLRERDAFPPSLRERFELPPGLGERDDLPPGLRERFELPPGVPDDFDGRAGVWEGRVGTNVVLEGPADGSSPMPEPTGLLLFSAGLLLSGAAVRRRRRVRPGRSLPRNPEREIDGLANALSSKEPNASGEPWSDLQTAWLEIPAIPSWQDFSARFDRCFRHVSLYVEQHVNDRERRRQIVTEVLTGSLDLFLAPRDEREELERLNASADRLLALGAPTLPGAGTSA